MSSSPSTAATGLPKPSRSRYTPPVMTSRCRDARPRSLARTRRPQHDPNQPTSREHPVVQHRVVRPALASRHDNVVEELTADDLRRLIEALRERKILRARGRIAARVVVREDERCPTRHKRAAQDVLDRDVKAAHPAARDL